MANTNTIKHSFFEEFNILRKSKFSTEHFIVVLPIALFAIFTFTLALPFTREATIWMLNENRPVEILTFLILMVSGFVGLKLAYEMFKQNESFLFVAFYAVFSLAMILTGMEEIAWGQQFWGFATPDGLKEMNMQGETTLHNIRGLHGNTEVIRLLFGVGGLIGVWLSRFSKFSKIAVPVILLSWFLIITAHASIDVFDDIFTLPKYMDAAISKLAELVELLISIAAFLYLYLNYKRFKETDTKLK